jgi:lipopolysaccharide cholinephosphotransferase
MGKINELQEVGLDILKEFSRAAEREKLEWFAMFGTLLGAVRHEGFIPWDDDIDIALTRRDYNRLRDNPSWFEEPYFLQTPLNDPAAAPRFIRLRRSDTAVISGFPGGYTRGGHMGAYIDICPLDIMPDGETARRVCKAASGIHRQMLASAALDECKGTEIPEHVEAFCYGAGGVEGLYSMFAGRYEGFCSRHTEGPYYSMPVLSGYRGDRVYDREWFSGSVLMRFEDINIPVPSGWREVLVASFPEGLHEPLARNRNIKYTDGRIIDLKRPYKDYVKRYTDMLDGIEGKDVYIFGAGDSLRIWLERYGKGVNVVCAFDNSKAKWGSAAYGTPVRNPAELPGLVKEGSRLIIASIYHKEISKQLESMGIKDYYIFIDGLNYSFT